MAGLGLFGKAKFTQNLRYFVDNVHKNPSLKKKNQKKKKKIN